MSVKETAGGIDVGSLLDPVIRLVHAAGQAVLPHYSGVVLVSTKADGSPVTIADQLAEDVILKGLALLAPGVPAVAEEESSRKGPPLVGDMFWLVDPLDGTAEFISRNGEFTVNVALIENGRPVLGVVHVPMTGETFAAAGPGTARRAGSAQGPWVAIKARRAPPDGLVVLTSRRHGDSAALDRFLAGQQVRERKPSGSSLKFCLLAAGEADVYPRFGPTMEWDTAAGHSILAAAGGRVLTEQGHPLSYGKPGFANPSFIARGLP